MKIYINNEIIWRKKYPTLPQNAVTPCLVLNHDNWDDFGFKTNYVATLFGSDGEIILKSSIKIGKKGEKEPKLSQEINKLPKGYYSLWQDINDYKILSEIPFHSLLLTSLNDICFNKTARRESEKIDVVNISLRRFSEAEKAFQEGLNILEKSPLTNIYSFNFKSNLTDIIFPEIHFDFNNKKYDLKRICSIIGKNGVGKTTLLAHIASALSGMGIMKSTIPKRPPFSKIIAISYSAFDEFHRPNKSERTFSYSYCGVRGVKENLLSQSQMKDKFRTAYHRIEEKELKSFWVTLIEDLVDSKYVNLFPEDKNVVSSFENLSSGQKFMVLSFSQILSTIKENSLLLFDEPETHLHPNGQSSLLKCLNRILANFDSYAILATHSPVFLQGILKENTIHLQKIENQRHAKELTVETFGQHFSILTEEIFTFSEGNHYFQERLKELFYGNEIEPLLSILNEIKSDGVKYTLESLKYEKYTD